MRFVKLVPLVLASFTLACSEAPESSVTDPGLSARFGKPISSASCAAALNRNIKTQMADLFAKPQLDQAKASWAIVEAQCSSQLDQARESMLAYVQYTIDNRSNIIPQPAGETAEENLIAHWASTFAFVGYTGPDQPSAVNLPVSIFGESGRVGVITQTTVERELTTGHAALTVPVQHADSGDTRGHLFVIHPLNENCLSGTSLRQLGPCYEFGSFPKVDGEFYPKVKVGVCQPEGTDLSKAALGHFKSVGFVEIPEQESYPTTCFPEEEHADGSWQGGFGDVLKRLAWHAERAFTPRNAYAVHGGLGGLGGGMSPFGGVYLEVFRATFENETVGSQPTSPELGSWGPVTVTPPGSIGVQNSLGQSSTGKLVVLSQAGGACRNCGGLTLQGNLHVAPGGTAPNNGVYEFSFIALQAGPTMKEAAFKIRDSNNRVIATVSFTVKSNKNMILFNGSDTGIPWVRYVPVKFLVRVDMDARRTALWMDENFTTPIFEDQVFLQSVSNISNIAADFGGIDSGTMGWDQIIVERKEDGT